MFFMLQKYYYWLFELDRLVRGISRLEVLNNSKTCSFMHERQEKCQISFLPITYSNSINFGKALNFKNLVHRIRKIAIAIKTV